MKIFFHGSQVQKKNGKEKESIYVYESVKIKLYFWQYFQSINIP